MRRLQLLHPRVRRLYWKGVRAGRARDTGSRGACGPSPGRVPVSDRKTLGGVSQSLSQFPFRAAPLARKQLILNIRRDVRVVEGARLEIRFAVVDGVLHISITVAKPST